MSGAQETRPIERSRSLSRSAVVLSRSAAIPTGAGEGRRSLVLLVIQPVGRSPTAPALALRRPGTAHPALSRPLLRTLPLPAVARDWP